MTPPKKWVVKFCERCFGAFDTTAHSRSDICENCRHELRLETQRRYAGKQRELARN